MALSKYPCFSSIRIFNTHNSEQLSKAIINVFSDNLIRGGTSFHSSSSSEIRFYTDGSKYCTEDNVSKVGAAYWIPSANIAVRFRLNDRSSSFTAEAIVIIKFLNFLSSSNLSSVNICTDSLSLLKAVNSSKKGMHKLCPRVNDIKNRLSKLLNEEQPYHIKFVWCPSHVAINGTERADREAKEAADSGLRVNNKIDYVQLIFSMSSIYDRMDESFLNSLNTNAGKFYFENFKHFNLKLLRDLSLNRNESCKIIRLISGYVFTGSYLFKMGLRENPLCECGALCQNLNHLFFECKNLDETRQSFYNNLLKMEIFPPYLVMFIIGIINKKIIKIILSFISNANLNL